MYIVWALAQPVSPAPPAPMTISSADIKSFARSKGADLVGIANTAAFAKYPEERRPEKLLADAKSVIVVGVRVLADTVKPNLLLSALHHITLNLYHNQIAYDVGRYLDDLGHAAAVVPHRIGNIDAEMRTSPNYMHTYPLLFALSTRHAAVEAGLGILGKSRLLLTNRFGPRQRLAAVVTDVELQPDPPVSAEDAEHLCPAACVACMRACPGEAISKEGLDWAKCNTVIKPHNGLYGYSACSECMVSCPTSRRRPAG